LALLAGRPARRCQWPPGDHRYAEFAPSALDPPPDAAAAILSEEEVFVTHHATDHPVSHHTALAGFGAAGFGLTLASRGGTAAQNTPPDALASHPLTGAWLAMAHPPLPDDPQVAVPSIVGADRTVLLMFPLTQAGYAAWADGSRLNLQAVIEEALERAATIGDAGAGAAATAFSALSPRQREVLGLLVAGHSDREIADALFISYRTATHHVGAILAKLDARTRAEAAVRAVRAGLI
jgi:DNA-binding CsgD family transcriptional regulator